MGRHMKATNLVRIVAVGFAGLMATGCVMSEKYEAEKARSLNFQRLLAQEEKRTAELDAEMKKVRRQFQEAEIKTRDMTSELQAVREELARTQEEAMSLKETASFGEEPPMDFGPADDDLLAGFGLDEPMMAAGEEIPTYHEVIPGETLFRLSRTYGVKVDQIKEWNNLRNDVIEVGQQLVVGYQ